MIKNNIKINDISDSLPWMVMNPSLAGFTMSIIWQRMSSNCTT